jgi:hypothetical protein
MILDPFYRLMSMANAAAVAVRPQLWSRHHATPFRSKMGMKNPSAQSALQTDLGREVTSACEPIPGFADQDPLNSARCARVAGLSPVKGTCWIPVL